jgi:ribosomal protein S18 acetylase RimI-like enzyme
MIRKATPTDFDDIQRLNQEVFDFEKETSDPHTDTSFPTSDIGQQFYSDIVNEKGGHFGYVYEEDDVIKGYVSLRVQNPNEYIHRTDVAILQLQTLGIDTKYRNQGIGKQLIEHVKQVAKDLGFSHLHVVATANNAHARHVYTSCGFKEFEIVHEMEL